MKRFFILVFVMGGACADRRASREDCLAVFDRIVEVELTKAGYRDAALTHIKKAELRRTLHPDIERCKGLRLRPGALACVRTAQTVEEMSHHCLR